MHPPLPVACSWFTLQQAAQRQDSGGSSHSGPTALLSPKLEPKKEPASAFDLLSGLISKTEAKPSPSTSQDTAKDDPLLMLAGLMKSVKPPTITTASDAAAPVVTVSTAAELKVEPIVSTQSSIPKVAIKVEPVVKQEPQDIAVKAIGTLGG